MAKASKFDAADYLKSPEAIADYLSEAFETGDERFIAEALGTKHPKAIVSHMRRSCK